MTKETKFEHLRFGSDGLWMAKHVLSKDHEIEIWPHSRIRSNSS